MLIFSKVFAFWNTLPHSGGILFNQGSKLGILITDLCGDVTETIHLTPNILDFTSVALKLKKGYFCYFQEPFQALKALFIYLFIYFYLLIYLFISYFFFCFDCYSYFCCSCCHRYCCFCCWSHRCFLCVLGWVIVANLMLIVTILVLLFVPYFTVNSVDK